MIVFWVDSGVQIGLGHLMRCLSLAEQLYAIGECCQFLLKDETARRIAADRGFNAIRLESVGLQDDVNSQQVMTLIKNRDVTSVIVDSYAVTADFLRRLRTYAPLIYLDDMKAFSYPCDVLVNYNIYGPDWEQDYTERQTSFGTRLLLGPQYAPLRKEFDNLPQHQIAKQVQRVFLSIGGSDSFGIMCRLLKAISFMPEWSEIEFHAVVGAMNPHREQIERMASEMGNVRVHFQLRRVADLMCQCDVAVSAAGSTLYELCACGVPTVTYVLADNQIPGARAFDRQGLIMMAGDCRAQGTEEKIISQLQRLIADSNLRELTSRQMQQVVDGKGAWRLAQALLSFVKAE